MKIIAEIGWNHMGDMNLAKEMITASKENGADMVKLQTWSVDRLSPGPWDTDGRREIYEKAELTKEKHIELYEYSNNLSIPFFTSVFSIEDARLLAYVEKDTVKIASFESRNKDLLSFCDGLFDTIYISTGTSTVDEIKESLEYIKTSNVVLLHCVSCYPLEPQNVNLPRILGLKGLCDRVGYSDHTPGIDAAGIVESCDSSKFKAGDSVVIISYDLGANTAGGFGQFIRVPDDWVMPLPKGLSLRESMIYGTAGYTAGLSVNALQNRETPGSLDR